jgi:methionyl-tRNA formyltransferase
MKCAGDKAIQITKLQKEGKKPMMAEDFLRGNKL